jgi:hypothetical protein
MTLEMHWSYGALEECWNLGSSAHALEPCLLIVVTLELDMRHLEYSASHVWTYLCLVG